MSEGSDILKLPDDFGRQAGDDGAILRTRRRKLNERRCIHHMECHLDQERRMVQCEKCGQWLDPFEWLLALANWQQGWISGLQQTRKLLERTKKELAEAKRLERNARARLRNIERRIAEKKRDHP